MKSASVLVPLAEGFEELEAVTIIDVLRRAGIAVTVAGLRSGAVTGAHGIALATDADFGAAARSTFDLVVLPGGMPGTTNLMEDERLIALLRSQHASGRRVAAICAAPMVLARAGLIDGVEVTSYPSVRAKLGQARVLDEPRVVRSGRIVTSQGPGTALEFALELVRELAGAGKADEIAEAMLVRREA
jgi:4-methyl-5(b-hydroxyethyl)-thiazole monophosphate biosynthesis